MISFQTKSIITFFQNLKSVIQQTAFDGNDWASCFFADGDDHKPRCDRCSHSFDKRKRQRWQLDKCEEAELSAAGIQQSEQTKLVAALCRFWILQRGQLLPLSCSGCMI